MTKDWDAVKGEIEDLSWVQKKRLDEVRKIMEQKHGFKASTRAYRMKLSEWGYTSRKAPQKSDKDARAKKRRRTEGENDEEDSDSDSSTTGAPQPETQVACHGTVSEDSTNLEAVLLGRANIRTSVMPTESQADTPATTLQGSEDLLPPLSHEEIDASGPVSGAASEVVEEIEVNGVVMSMLEAVLDNDSQKLELLVMQHPDHLNLPIGQPFDIPDSIFYNHPTLESCIFSQHPGQTLLDIASAIPTGPVLWVLLAHGAKGSIHPLGPDLALHNAIKNGRVYTVQPLLMPGRSNVHGEPGSMWKPILQAVYWNQPQIVRLLIDRGANVNEVSPWIDEGFKNALLHCTERRQRDFFKPDMREASNKVLKLLLNAGADIHAQPGGPGSPTVFESFLQPMQGDPHWISKLSSDEMECLEAFIQKGANLKTPFMGFTCGAPSCNHFQHQLLWHTTPSAARSLVDNASPTPEGNGNNLLHEIVGSCPDAKRHPSDTLRDIEVLLGRGADPNLLDDSLLSPLRRCIEKCPAVDIIPRLRLLLDGGADPELKHSNRLPPYVLAARTFEEPLRSQVMDFIVAKIKGRQPRVVYDDTYIWGSGYFPIPSEPTLEQVHMYSEQNGDFNINLERMIPEDVRSVFRQACFSVASINFLNTATMRAKMAHPLAPTNLQKDEIHQVVAQRQAHGLPAYNFDQDFVMLLLKPNMAPILPAFSSVDSPLSDTFMLPHQTPIVSSSQDEPSILSTACTFQFNAPRPPSTTAIRSRTPPAPDNPDVGFSMPETTLIRWPNMSEGTRPGDVRKAKENVLRYRCDECASGNLLTKAELDRHVVEHEHSKWCVDEGCRRRFCAQRS